MNRSIPTSFSTRRTAASVLRREEGSALIAVVLVAMIIGALASLALATGRQSEWSSTSDRNHEQSLGAAEAGLHEVITRISAEIAGLDTTSPNFWAIAPGSGMPCSPSNGKAATTCTTAKTDAQYSGTTPQGKYWYWVTRCSRSTIACPGAPNAQGFIVDVQSATGGRVFGRGRHIQGTLAPPFRFARNAKYALFSYTSITIQNNDQVLNGDVFANTNILINNSNQDPTLKGSITSATGWIELDSGVHVTGNVWSGGYNSNVSPAWAMNLGGGAVIDGWAMASVTAPTDPTTCGAEIPSNYNVSMSSGSVIKGDLTTLGSKTGSGSVQGTIHQACSAASPAKPLPEYKPDPKFFDASTYHEFSSVAAFQGWMYCNGGLTDLHGTFIVTESAPAQTGNGVHCGNESSYHRIDLTSAVLTGPLTIVTNAPIYTGDLNDKNVGSDSVLVLVSHYQPPTSTSCSTVDDTSECAIHIKNGFALNPDGTCKTATLAYADKGPVAVKNGSTLCGSIVSNGILVKNGQTVTYDDRVDNIVGFGPNAYDVVRWEELAAK